MAVYHQSQNFAHNGFTFIELVATLASIGVLLLILSELLIGLYQHKQLTINEIELRENLILALDAISNDLRMGLSAAKNGDSLQITTAEGKISYYLAKDTMASEHLFDLKGFVLYRRVDDSQPQPIANFIEQLTGNIQPEKNATIMISGYLGDEIIMYQRTIALGGNRYHLLY